MCDIGGNAIRKAETKGKEQRAESTGQSIGPNDNSFFGGKRFARILKFESTGILELKSIP
jgi:hypothetical protein